jgi:hypothetical protein
MLRLLGQAIVRGLDLSRRLRDGWEVRLIGGQQIFARCGDGDALCRVAYEAGFAGAHGDALVLLNGIDQDYGGDFGWIGGDVVADDASAKGVSDEYERTMFAEAVKSVVEFEIELGVGAGLRAWVAPSVSATIVGTDPGESFDALLNENPIEGEITEAVFDDDCGGPFSSALT